jgi:hypothetical protein
MGWYIFDLVTLALTFDLLIGNLNLVYIFWMVCTTSTTLIFHMCFFWQHLSKDTIRFDLVTLTLVFDLHIDKFNHAYIFWLVCSRTLIFHISLCCDKSFQWVPTGLTLWPWPLCLTNLLKTLTLAVSLEWYVLWLGYFTRVFLETKSFRGY